MAEPTAQELELTRSRELIAKAWNDPNLRPGLRAHVKTVMPDYRLPDDDFEVLTAPIRQENAALAKQVGDLVEALKKRDEAAEKREQEQRDTLYADRLEAAVKRFNLTDEGRQKMIEHMKATANYSDPLGAAAFIVSQEPPAAPNGALWGNNTLNFAGSAEKSDEERYKLLHSGLDGPGKYLEAEIREAFGPNSKEYVAKEMGRMYADLAFAQ